MKFFLPALLLLILAGCSSKPEMPKMKMAMGVPDGAVDYKPVPTDDLHLSLLSSTDLHAGKKTELVFALSNNGRTTIRIPEWYSNEADNIEIDCQIWYPDMAMPINNAWMTLPVTVKQPPLRYPLKLGSQMFVAIEVPLDFLNNLVVERGTERRYFLQARLNLNSVSAASRYSSIIIRNPADMPKTSK
jgi:hypothetical protein